MDPATGIPFVALCLFAQGFFSGSEMALVSADRPRLVAEKERGDAGAALALKLLGEEERLLGTCLIGTNLCVITGTTIVSAVLAHQGVTSEWYVALAFIPFALIFGEALPKTVYQFHANTIAPLVARPIAVAQTAFTPLLWIVSAWAHLLGRLGAFEQRVPVTRQEILMLLEREPVLEPDEQRMLRGVFEIGTLTAEDCMTPLVDVAAIDVSETLDDAIAIAVESGHSRILVYRERIDAIAGVLQHQDLLFGAAEDRTVETLMQPVRFVPESKRVDELLHEMRRGREHIVVVVDEYGGSVGIVTIEDIVEQIVGDIRDERDEEEPAIKQIGDYQWRVPARTPIEELEEVIGVTTPEGDHETVAGLILQTLGRIPATGEVVIVGALTFLVEEASDRAVVLVVVTLASPSTRSATPTPPPE